MTAINMMVQPRARAGFIISDGAHTALDGRLLRNAPKVIYGCRFPWAMGITGNVAPEVLFAQIAEAQPLNPKQLERRLPTCMRRAVAMVTDAQGIAEASVLLQVAGTLWDAKARRIKGFVLSNQPGTIIGQEVKPDVWYETTMIVPCGHPDGLAGYLGREADLTDPSSFNPETDGLTLIQAQRDGRQVNVTPGLTWEGCRIGGDVDLTVVNRHGVKVWKIHEWPDVLGERIDLAA